MFKNSTKPNKYKNYIRKDVCSRNIAITPFGRGVNHSKKRCTRLFDFIYDLFLRLFLVTFFKGLRDFFEWFNPRSRMKWDKF